MGKPDVMRVESRLEAGLPTGPRAIFELSRKRGYTLTEAIKEVIITNAKSLFPPQEYGNEEDKGYLKSAITQYLTHLGFHDRLQGFMDSVEDVFYRGYPPPVVKMLKDVYDYGPVSLGHYHIVSMLEEIFSNTGGNYNIAERAKAAELLGVTASNQAAEILVKANRSHLPLKVKQSAEKALSMLKDMPVKAMIDSESDKIRMVEENI